MKQDKNATRPSGVSRRTVVKGAAWAVPAITVASAVPAVAASGPPPGLILGVACKNPGNSCASRPKGYTVGATLTNTSSLDVYVYAVTYTTVGTTLNLTYAPPPALPFVIPANSSINVFLNASSQNSANQVFTLNVTIYWSHTPNPADDPEQSTHLPVTESMYIPKTPPECTCPD